ncbi:tubulin-folding cofactor B-like [Littorina saxatilis]|uniref:CAP-Gly domain-containing protein n=1 Tax=Littorina saxatilis TaxID=31220 RepID=A0AAN9GCK6_9CAEN
MSHNIQVITEDFLNVTITSNISSFGSEKRFPKSTTVGNLKGKLELVTGGSARSMKLFAYDKENKLVCALDNDDALLGSYPIDSGMILHVEDKQLCAGEFDDVSKVEKFEIPEDEYAKRTDSVRAFKEKNKIGRFNPEAQKKKEEEQKQKEEEEKQQAATMKAGDRCQVRVPGQPSRRGTVRYVGEADFKPGLWVGVQYDEPHGKNDGSVAGKRYFECPQKYGGFVKPTAVEVGDFPEEDLGFDEDEM